MRPYKLNFDLNISDQVMVTHAWQDQHQLRNEPLMNRDAFAQNMKVLMSKDASMELRFAARQAVNTFILPQVLTKPATAL